MRRSRSRLVAMMLTVCLFAAGGSVTAYGADPNWYQDQNGWHYYLDNSRMARSQWLSIGGKWYYFDASSRMQTGWVTVGNQKYYCQGDGAMVTGWQEIDQKLYYFNDSGACAVNTVTPDNYMTDKTGARINGYRVIAGVSVQAPSLFVNSDSSAMGGWSSMMGAINSIGQLIYANTGGARTFHVYRNRISWCSLNGNQETELLSLEKMTGSHGYLIRIRTVLNRKSTDVSKGETYDYQILRLFCYGISSQAAKLDDAIYSSFAEKNVYGLGRQEWVSFGDCKVIYEAENGAGCYRIEPAQ